jgi:hypothetical protein
MKSDELYKFIETEILPISKEIMQSKGEAYSGLEDKLGNFKRCANLAGVPIEKAWYIYFVKHFDALSAFIRGEYKDSESIKGRIVDLINYLFLLAAILKEQGRLDERTGTK